MDNLMKHSNLSKWEAATVVLRDAPEGLLRRLSGETRKTVTAHMIAGWRDKAIEVKGEEWSYERIGFEEKMTFGSLDEWTTAPKSTAKMALLGIGDWLTATCG